MKYLKLKKKADSVYRKGSFDLSVEMYRRLIDLDASQRTDLYYLAVSFDKTGQADSALHYLAIAAGEGLRYTTLQALETDRNFILARDHEKWEEVTRQIKSNIKRYIKAEYPKDSAKLMEMKELDQQYRVRSVPKEDWKKQKQMDRVNQLTLKKMIARIGWPSYSKVGEEACQAAWLIAQHADNDVAFQEFCLIMIEETLQSYDCDPTHFAYMTDRVLVNLGRKQRFGTQYIIEYDSITSNEDLRFKPMEAFEEVDLLRLYYKLPPLAVYKEGALKRREK